MAHWAELDENNVVIRVLVGDNNEYDEGYQWLIDNLGGTWVQTSYNTHFGKHVLGGTPLRKNYAGIGFTYDKKLDAFIPPKLYPSWKLDAETCTWVAPTEPPIDGKIYVWDEEDKKWITK
jgi:hypothetical protein